MASVQMAGTVRFGAVRATHVASVLVGEERIGK